MSDHEQNTLLSNKLILNLTRTMWRSTVSCSGVWLMKPR